MPPWTRSVYEFVHEPDFEDDQPHRPAATSCLSDIGRGGSATGHGYGQANNTDDTGCHGMISFPSDAPDERAICVRRMALAFQACWSIQLPEPHLIGELVATESDNGVSLIIGPDRHHGLGSPFSVREYLREYIKSSLIALEKQQGIEEYKEQFLESIRDFVTNRIYDIPAVVENIPIVAMHADMSPHNIIVSSHIPSEIRAVIDWEFVTSAPHALLHRIIEMLFRRPAPNRFGQEYDRAGELREAFWDAIPPHWKSWNETESTRTF